MLKRLPCLVFLTCVVGASSATFVLATGPDTQGKVEHSTVGSGPEQMTAAELEKLAATVDPELTLPATGKAEHATVSDEPQRLGELELEKLAALEPAAARPDAPAKVEVSTVGSGPQFMTAAELAKMLQPAPAPPAGALDDAAPPREPKREEVTTIGPPGSQVLTEYERAKMEAGESGKPGETTPAKLDPTLSPAGTKAAERSTILEGPPGLTDWEKAKLTGQPAVETAGQEEVDQ